MMQQLSLTDSGQQARPEHGDSVTIIVQHLHGLVVHGPWDLDIAAAMSPYGYNEVKWAEGQSMLAELVSSETPARRTLAAAKAWYEEAAAAAQRALSAQPQLLTKLGLIARGVN